MAAQCRLAPSIPGAYSLTTATLGNASVSSRALPQRQPGLFLKHELSAAMRNPSN